MDLFKMGKSLFKSGGSSSGGGGSSDLSNPLALFKQLDRNGDGKITEEDFVLVVQNAGIGGAVGESAVRMAFKQIDKNRNGTLEASEALAAFEIVKGLFDKVKSSQQAQ